MSTLRSTSRTQRAGGTKRHPICSPRRHSISMAVRQPFDAMVVDEAQDFSAVLVGCA